MDWILDLKMNEKMREKEKVFVENELRKLVEMTLRLEDELNLITLNNN